MRIENAEIVVVSRLRQLTRSHAVHDRGALTRSTSAPQLAAYKLGRSFRHFGHNAPHTMVTLSAGVATEWETVYERSLGDPVTSFAVPARASSSIPGCRRTSIRSIPRSAIWRPARRS
jgi:hypothetical protein